MQRGFTPIFVVIAVLVIGVTLGVGYYVGTKKDTSQEQITKEFDNFKKPEPLEPTEKPSFSAFEYLKARVYQSPRPSNSPEISPSGTPKEIVLLKTIPIQSTEGWKDTGYKGVSFKIPSNTRFEINYEGSNSEIGLIWFNDSQYSSPISFKVSKYSGGSRREQYKKEIMYGSEYQCNEIFEEVLFGNVKGLQIAKDGGWCQGGGGGIVIALEDKFIVFDNLSYDPDSKQIYRSDSPEVRDTIISTLSITN